MARVPGCDANYEVADLFRQRCLQSDMSLLWPDETTWTNENIESALTALQSETDGDHNHVLHVLLSVAETSSPSVARLLGDTVALYWAAPADDVSFEEKQSSLEQIMERTHLRDPASETRALVESAWAASSKLRAGWGRLVRLRVAYLLAVALLHKRQDLDFASTPLRIGPRNMLANEIQSRGFALHRTTYSSDVLNHLFFPNAFEDLIPENKKKIISRYRAESGIPGGVDSDEAIHLIREYLEKQSGAPIDFYNVELQASWNKSVRRRRLDTTELGDTFSPTDQPQFSHVFDMLSNSTFLSFDALNEINTLLKDKRQVIFEGPPGSGKTWVAEKFARWFTGDSLDESVPPDHVETVQFHQSYGYEDFVQGIRPETNAAGGLTYAVRDGIFKRLCDRAANDPDQPYVLLIDEINRGNISRIFGELLYLLEYRNRSVALPYGAEGEKLTIPENLYIIGTMNSADRSLAQVDYALRRRFYFIRFMPVIEGRAPVLEQWLRAQPGLDDRRRSHILRQFIDLNMQVEEYLSADVQVGHSYFMQPWIADADSEERIWKYAVRPLLEEYFHHQKNRQDILDGLTPAFASVAPALADGIDDDLDVVAPDAV